MNYLEMAAHIREHAYDNFLQASHALTMHAGRMKDGAFDKAEFIDTMTLPWPIPAGRCPTSVEFPRGPFVFILPDVKGNELSFF